MNWSNTKREIQTWPGVGKRPWLVYPIVVMLVLCGILIGVAGLVAFFSHQTPYALMGSPRLFWPSDHQAAWSGLVLGLFAFGFTFVPWPRPVTVTKHATLPARPKMKPFERYGVEWADGMVMRCPVHHTPLLFWPIRILADRHMRRDQPRAATDADCPYQNDYSRRAGSLWCVDGKEEFTFDEEISVGRAREYIRLSQAGELNRNES